jgi:hypothetical protein
VDRIAISHREPSLQEIIQPYNYLCRYFPIIYAENSDFVLGPKDILSSSSRLHFQDRDEKIKTIGSKAKWLEKLYFLKKNIPVMQISRGSPHVYKILFKEPLNRSQCFHTWSIIFSGAWYASRKWQTFTNAHCLLAVSSRLRWFHPNFISSFLWWTRSFWRYLRSKVASCNSSILKGSSYSAEIYKRGMMHWETRTIFKSCITDTDL